MEKKYNKITIYSDLDKAAEAQAMYAAQQDPIERIRETVELILRVYPLDKKKPNTNKIYFDKE